MDGGEFKKKLEHAFRASLEREMDAVKVATATLLAPSFSIIIPKACSSLQFQQSVKKGAIAL